MSKRSRIFLIAITISIVVVMLLALVAVGAYWFGRNSVQTTTTETNLIEETAVQDQLSTDEPLKTAGNENNADEGLPESKEEPEQVPQKNETQVEVRSVANQTDREPLELESSDLDLLLEVWDIVDREYDGELPVKEDVTYRAIDGSLRLLNDEFTRFIPPEIAERTREQLDGRFEGIGAFVDLNDEGYLVIVRPIEGQPADIAGLKSGDVITHVDGESILGKSLEAIIAEVKGPKGTKVTLTVARQGLADPLEVTITRDLIEIPIVEGELLDDGIAYLRLTSFSGNAVEQLEQEIEALLEQKPKGIILDLRDNPGGFLDQSVDVADLFLDDGVVLFQRDSQGVEEIFKSDNGDLAEDIELVVLVNAGSASASEIVAGAIQDRDRGLLIGETTFGKGSVQQSNTLSDGSELRVTIARWYTPDEKSIDHEGISPDIVVETPDEFGGEGDTQLQQAIDYLLSNQS